MCSYVPLLVIGIIVLLSIFVQLFRRLGPSVENS